MKEAAVSREVSPDDDPSALRVVLSWEVVSLLPPPPQAVSSTAVDAHDRHAMERRKNGNLTKAVFPF